MENTKQIPYNFGITKNVPIDVRYWIESLTVLDTEIPLPLRYEGLTFFVSNGVPDTDANGEKGFLYIFEKDLQTPIKLHEFVLRYVVRGLDLRWVGGIGKKFRYHVTDVDFYESDSIIEILNKEAHKKLGSVINLENLGVSVVWDGLQWKYHSGDWNFPSNFAAIIGVDANWKSYVWYTLKKEGVSVFIRVDSNTTKRFIIDSKNELKKVVSVTGDTDHYKLDNTKTLPELSKFDDERYFDNNGILFQSLGGDPLTRKVYQLSRKTKIIPINLKVGVNTITHNLNSENCECVFYIKHSNVDDGFQHQNITIGGVDWCTMGKNDIQIHSAMEITGVNIKISSDE